MFTYIYDWIKNLVFYLILMTMLMQIIPDSDYKKYIRFFTGLVLILVLARPQCLPECSPRGDETSAAIASGW